MNAKSTLTKSTEVVIFLALFLGGLYVARSFFVPLALGGILAVVLTPLCSILEKKGIHRFLASTICLLVLLSILAAVLSLVSWQVADFVRDFPVIRERLIQIFADVKHSISEAFGMSGNETNSFVQFETFSTSPINWISYIMQGLLSFILVLAYVFMFIFFRDKLHRFALMLVPEKNKSETERIIHDASKVGQHHLLGISITTMVLWVMYGIGFSLVGVKYALLFAVICGLLEIIPYVGNFTGSSMTALMVIAQGGNSKQVIGVIIIYMIIQTIQSYFLEPLIVGRRVNINPLFTIISLVLGNLIWGIGGMILALPLLGMIKIVFDHIEELKPYGYLIGNEKRRKKHWMIDSWFK